MSEGEVPDFFRTFLHRTIPWPGNGALDVMVVLGFEIHTTNLIIKTRVSAYGFEMDVQKDHWFLGFNNGWSNDYCHMHNNCLAFSSYQL